MVLGSWVGVGRNFDEAGNSLHSLLAGQHP